NDTLNGNAGNDVLDGGIGNDTLFGGAGTDVFKFSVGSGHDIIADFQSNPVGGQDLLDISGLGITAAAFAGSVAIAAAGANTLITMGANTIQLNGVGAGTINGSDFMFAHLGLTDRVFAPAGRTDAGQHDHLAERRDAEPGSRISSAVCGAGCTD